MSPTVAFSIVSHKLTNHYSLLWIFQPFLFVSEQNEKHKSISRLAKLHHLLFGVIK